MKKHSGNVIYFGIMTSIFGFLLMGAVSAATGLVMRGAFTALEEMADAAGNLALILLALGVLSVGAGMLMRSGAD